MRVVILGGGSWGTALAHLLAARGCGVRLWLRDARVAASINLDRQNPRYLPELTLHPGVQACPDPAEAFDGAEVCVLAVPCQNLRLVLRDLAGFFRPGLPAICVSKGLELATGKTMSTLVAEELPQARYAILSGPSFAVEVAKGKPSAVVLACAEKTLAESLRRLFSTPSFRVYSSADVPGVELGGALKNIIAIAAGISDGLRLGHNARAALLTRGLAEMSRLGVAMGALPGTFMGLSGMGDLVLTCTGDLSRNRQVGLGLAAGKNLEQIRAEMHMVAEGVKTTEAAVALGETLGVDLPVASAVRAVLAGRASAAETVRLLMERELKNE